MESTVEKKPIKGCIIGLCWLHWVTNIFDTHRSTHMNPFQLRFEMLQTARQMLEAEYYAKKTHNEDATWPSLDQVLERARALNSFVSEK